MEDLFDLDYHESEEALLLVYNLGRLSIEWNMLEQFFSATIWELFGDYPVGMAVTGGMGNQSKADLVLRLSREKLKNAKVLTLVEFACKVFNILRENRNILIHSHSIYPPMDDGKPIWTRATGKAPFAHTRVEADFYDLETLIKQICDLGKFMIQLTPYLHVRRRRRWNGRIPPELPAKFELPQLLAKVANAEPVTMRPSRKGSSRKPRKSD